MATTYSDQYSDAFVEKPSTKIRPGDVNSPVKFLYFSITLGVLAVNDIIKVAKLPLGARVKNVSLTVSDLGATGTLVAGLTSGTNSLETADDDAFLTTVDVNAGADTNSMQQQMEAGGANAGYLKELLDEVDVELKATAVTTAAGTAKGFIEYIY